MGNSFEHRSAPAVAPSVDLSVLIVDDEPAIRLLVQEVFRRRGDGFQVVGTACGGHECLQLWEELRPDVLVLDISMPDLDGHEVARRIHSADPDQAVVLFSSYIDATTTTDEGLNVPKGRLGELPRLIEQWLDRREANAVGSRVRCG